MFLFKQKSIHEPFLWIFCIHRFIYIATNWLLDCYILCIGSPCLEFQDNRSPLTGVASGNGIAPQPYIDLSDPPLYLESYCMLNALTQLLVLQENDRHILQIQSELANLEPQRAMLNSMLSSAQNGLEAARAKLKSIEAERNKCELEVKTQKQLIEKYSLQQYQTKKNDEYRACGQQIDTCRKNIMAMEDAQLEWMEKAEGVQKELAAAGVIAKQAQAEVETKIKNLAQREEGFKKELAGLQSKRVELAKDIDERIRSRYERLLKQKGDKALVGVTHSVCGGCHMQLPPQIILSCQSETELVLCPNCGRILYCTPDMELTPTE